jgi:hypothetical protein
VDVAHAEAVEGGLDALIEKRDKQRRREEGERQAHELWQQSVERYHAARRRRNRAAWFAYFCNQAQAHAAIAEDYERRAEELCEGGDAA